MFGNEKRKQKRLNRAKLERESNMDRINQRFDNTGSLEEIKELFERFPPGVKKISKLFTLMLVVLIIYNLSTSVFGKRSPGVEVKFEEPKPRYLTEDDPWLRNMEYLFESGQINDSTINHLNMSLGDTCDCPSGISN